MVVGAFSIVAAHLLDIGVLGVDHGEVVLDFIQHGEETVDFRILGVDNALEGVDGHFLLLEFFLVAGHRGEGGGNNGDSHKDFLHFLLLFLVYIPCFLFLPFNPKKAIL